MEEQEIFNNEVDEIRKNMVIELSSWWGHRYPGYEGIIITNNKEVYEYQYYHIVPDDLKENGKYIRKIKDLTDKEFEKIILFINKKIIPKKFSDEMMFDAGFTVAVNYNGVNKVIRNNKGFGNNLKIYDLAEKMLKDIISNK